MELAGKVKKMEGKKVFKQRKQLVQRLRGEVQRESINLMDQNMGLVGKEGGRRIQEKTTMPLRSL